MKSPMDCVSRILSLVAACSLAACGGASVPSQSASYNGAGSSFGVRAGSPENRLGGTYWYVPQPYLPAYLSINSKRPRIVTQVDQTVWHFDGVEHGYVYGISATNIGFGWSYMLLVGSVVPSGAVKFSFAPLGAANPKDPTTKAITIGDGVLSAQGSNVEFLMQMTTGTATASVTHWAYMRQVRPQDPQWHALPGYRSTSISDLKGLQTPIQRRPD